MRFDPSVSISAVSKQGAATESSQPAPAQASITASAGFPASALVRAFDVISARTSRPSPLVSSSTRIASRKLPNAAPADVSETASEDISSGAGWYAACSRAAPQTSWASPHSSLIRIVNSRSRSPMTTPRTSTTRSPLNAMYSLSSLSKLSTAGAASRGVLRILPSKGSGRSCRQDPSHASPIVNIINGGTASCGPARINAGPPLA